MVPFAVESRTGGGTDRLYDTDRSGQADYAEVLSPDGMVIALRYDTTGDGALDLDIDLDEARKEDCRHLIIIVDSIPFTMVRDLWHKGRFRLFHPPGRVISPFPVMTDLCLSELFGTTPCPGVESEYYDGRTLMNGYLVYASEGNVPWQRHVDYHLSSVAHAVAYLGPREWYGHELRRIQELFMESAQARFAGYIVGTSALGARLGRNGHQEGLIQLDRFCQWITFKTRGRTHITLLSDHGHNLVRSERIPLPNILEEFGYRVRRTLEKPGDVVVPEFGMVTCAAIHTRDPELVAGDVVGVEGVELTAYCDARDRVVVMSREGRAEISRSPAGFRYARDYGDPLRLEPILADLAACGKADGDGFVGDEVLMDATLGHVYPDVVYRLWRAFHGLTEHTPDVLVSIRDGWHCGSPAMSNLVQLRAAHGSLRQSSSSGFSMTTAGVLPGVVRMERLAGRLEALDVPARSGGNTGAPSIAAAE